MLTTANPQMGVCLALIREIDRADGLEAIYQAALTALEDGLGVHRSAVLLFDHARVMRFVAWRGVSDGYRSAVEGHSPWLFGATNASPLVVADVAAEPSFTALRPTIEAEGIAALAFIPLMSGGGVIGKFMLYSPAPRALADDELQLATLIASQVAFAIERTVAEQKARRSEQRLRFALDAASMGTWEWDLSTNNVEWSENLATLHGLPAGTFDGTFASYEREIHPDDRPRVLASASRALTEGIPHDVEYRILSPDGTMRWVEGKGRVEYEAGRPARMTGVCIMATRRKEAELARLALAEEASRSKDEFLATLSHELRTPLNAILGWVQLLERGQLAEGRTAQALDVIGRNARLQAQLIEDILDVSRIITGKLELERLPIGVPVLVDGALDGVAPTAAAKGVVLERQVSADLPVLEGDPKRLQQVLGNLLSNAVKFTPAGGHVSIHAASVEGGVRLDVIDDGQGIDPLFLPHVFERFRQGDGRSTRQHGGLGLGLAITRHLVEQHGGRVEAHSEGPGRGSRMTVWLPAAARVERDGQMRRGASVAAAPGCLDGRTVLVVDDVEDSRDLIVTLVEGAGGHAVACPDGASALARVDTWRPDVVIADIGMPHMDGYMLLARLRQRHPGVRAVAVTAHARLDDRNRALEAGYDAYLTKPVDAAAFLDDLQGLTAFRRPTQ
ncbi:MAG TPA: ATP-binding protein [Luteitalea sp.]|nr:ATP-binding protein [Luteitalea sp.]